MLSYIGGKSKIGPRLIVPNIPRKIEIFCEPFSGMMWTFFTMPLEQFTSLKKVIYNDFNPLNVNLFNCVTNYNEFHKIIKDIPSQKSELFYQFQKELFSKDFQLDLSSPNYEVAYKYAYILSQVWSGTNPEKGKFIDLKGKYTSKFDSFKKKLVNSKWQNHFDKITKVENLDFQQVIEKYDSPTSYFYCDPPYHTTEKYYANHDFGIETHERLADCLRSMTGKFSLSYYDFPQLSEWFPKDKYTWKSSQFSKAAMAKSGKSQSKSTELLIMNY